MKHKLFRSLSLAMFCLLFMGLVLPPTAYAKSPSRKSGSAAKGKRPAAQPPRGVIQDSRKAHDPIPVDGYIKVTDNRQVIDPPPPRGFDAPQPLLPPPPQNFRQRPPQGTLPPPGYIKVTDNRQVIDPPPQSSSRKNSRAKGTGHRKHKHKKHFHKIR